MQLLGEIESNKVDKDTELHRALTDLLKLWFRETFGIEFQEKVESSSTFHETVLECKRFMKLTSMLHVEIVNEACLVSGFTKQFHRNVHFSKISFAKSLINSGKS